MRRRDLVLSLLAAAACASAAACGSDPASPDGGIEPPSDAVARCTLPSLELNVATLGGCFEPGTADGPRGRARFANPSNVAIGPTGLVYVADFDSSRIRVVDPSGETLTLLVSGQFQHPFGLAVSPGGALYVETDANDQGKHEATTGTIWRVDAISGDARVIARDLGRPRGLAMLPDGKIAMADHLHHTVSILDPETGAVAPLAGATGQPGYANGTGAEVRFAQPYDIALLPDGDLAVSDMDNHRIRRVTLAGVVTDLAGSGTAGNLDGPASVATFDAPQALAIAPGGSLYVTDIHRYVIRRVFGGQVTTVAGDGGRGWLDSDNPRTAKLAGLEGMDADGQRLVIADGNRGDGAAYHHVRVIDLTFL